MSNEPLPPGARRTITLARLAAILAVSIAIAFGLCSASWLTGELPPGLFVVFILIEGLCLAGLVAVGALAILRSLRRLE